LKGSGTLKLDMSISRFVFFCIVAGLLGCHAPHVSHAADTENATPDAAAGHAPAARDVTPVGPSASLVRPTEHPIDVSTRKLPRFVERDWLQRDCRLIWRIRGSLPPLHDPASFLATLRRPSTDDPRDFPTASHDERDGPSSLGFGLFRSKTRLGGGYTSCDVTWAQLGGEIAELRVVCYSHFAERSGLRPIYDLAFGEAFTLSYDETEHLFTATIEYTFPGVVARVHEALASKLGPLRPAAVPSELSGDYSRLTSMLDSLTVGAACYEDGSPPAGRREMESLLKGGRHDLLRNVLRGPNPEGRAYAAIGLFRAGQLAPLDRLALEALQNEPPSLQTCSGCMLSTASTRDVFEREMRTEAKR
jgi:hypothetical protein